MEILTDEEQAQIPKIQKKWREIVFSTEPLDRGKAERAARLAYAALDEKLPPIVYCTSPQDAFQKLANSAYSTKGNQKKIEGMARRIEQVLSQQLRWELVGQLHVKEVNELVEELGRLLADEIGIKVRKMAIVPTSPGKKLSKQLEFQINSQIEREGRKKLVGELKLVGDESASKLEKQLGNHLETVLLEKLVLELESLLENDLNQPLWRDVMTRMTRILLQEINRKDEDKSIQAWQDSVGYIDFGFSVRNYVGNKKCWSSLQSLLKDGGWMYATEEYCFVCDRPRRIAIDKQKRIRGAIKFADGYKISLDESTEFKKVAVASNNPKAVPGRKVASSRGDRGDGSSRLTKKVGLLNKIVGIIIYIVMSLPLAIVWIVLIIPRLSLKATSSIGFYIFQGILLMRDSSLKPSFSGRVTRSSGVRPYKPVINMQTLGRQNDRIDRTVSHHGNERVRRSEQDWLDIEWEIPEILEIPELPIDNVASNNDELFEVRRGENESINLDDRRNRQGISEQDPQLISEELVRSNYLFISPQRVSIFDIFNKTSQLRIPITREQKIMIRDCRKKWMSIEVSRERINLQRAKEATISLYAALGLSEPEIVWASSPYEALQQIIDLKINFQKRSLKISIESKLKADNIPRSGFYDWSMSLHNHRNVIPRRRMQQIIARQIGGKIIDNNGSGSKNNSLYYIVNHQLNTNCIMPSLWSDVAAWLDFQSNALKVIDSQKVSYHFWKVIQECGWIFPFRGICVICDRPLKMNLDNEYRLHGEGEPAVEYADGSSIYAYRGVGLPEKYRIHPDKWRYEWILEERNAELRRVLIEGIGYDRMSQELPYITLDIWKEYTLLRIADGVIDENLGEPIILLKMTCPSTGHIHALRVPPNMRTSAREAISWVNGGIDPEEFSVAT